MKRRLLYITVLASVMLASCAKEKRWEQTLSETGEKTPITVTAVMDSEASNTKAVNKEFEENDQLLAYLRHVTWDDDDPANPRTLVTADKSPLLVTFTKGSEAMAAYGGGEIIPVGTGVALGLTSSNTQQTSDLTASPILYWDDFSNSSSAATDLRTDGHYLESYYGYCYNGCTPSPALDNATGVLVWTVNPDQFTNGIKTSDLLWSAEQTPVAYNHNNGRPGLVLPYTHAMSKVTIEIALDEGFDVDGIGKAKAFGANQTTPTLYANRVTTTTAPTYTHSTTVAAGDARKIQMRLADDEVTNLKARVYEAVIAPTVMKNGNLLAQVTVDGNKYDINLTDAVLTTKPAGATYAWSSKLKAFNEADGKVVASSGDYSSENGGITLPGVNYRIKVTLKKQKIDVKAYITDWYDVKASVDGTIMFDADVVSDNATGTAVTATSFDLYRSLTNADADSYDADGVSDGIQKASTYTYNTDKWVGDPLLYWINGSTPYYFRALAQVADPAGHPNVITSVDGSQAATQGVDLLWAQTSAHTGKNASDEDVKTYAAGAAIDPRTGDVPLTFEHAMTKVSVLLKTDKDASGADIPIDAQVDVAGATITIINLYNGGTINVKTGDIESLTSPLDITPTPGEPRTILDEAVTWVDGFYGWRNNIVIPQKLDQNREGADRTESPSYYQSNELTAIYPNTNPAYESLMSPETSANTSIGTGEAAYYLTSELVVVPEVLFTDSDLATINTHNAGLPGAVSTTTVKEAARLYTLEEFNTGHFHQDFTVEQFNTIPDAGKIKEVSRSYTLEEFRALVLTEAQYDALPAKLREKTEDVLYTAETAATENEDHLVNDENGVAPGGQDYITTYQGGYEPVSAGDIQTPATYYSFSEYLTHNPLLNAAITPEQYADYTGDKTRPAVLYTYSEYTALESLTAEMFTALPAELKTKAAVYYTAAEANAYNANLPGAVKVGDVKVPAHYKLPSPAPASHNAGDLKQAGNKIMLYVTLADGTRYGIELAKCEETSSHTAITEWQRGKHYTYTISLQKEQITFRALIKDWVETSGGGNANLEWD